MAKKELATILSTMPAATVHGQQLANKEEQKVAEEFPKTSSQQDYIAPMKRNSYNELDKIVARVPKQLKEELKMYVKNNKGQTEASVIMSALKLKGFTVNSEWLVDKRTIR